jgi:hypothetical protein
MGCAMDAKRFTSAVAAGDLDSRFRECFPGVGNLGVERRR